MESVLGAALNVNGNMSYPLLYTNSFPLTNGYHEFRLQETHASKKQPGPSVNMTMPGRNPQVLRTFFTDMFK